MSIVLGTEFDATRTAQTTYLTTTRYCTRTHCRLPYTESQNRGRWLCRAYHPGAGLPRTADDKYSCCNRAEGKPGCVKADHTEDRQPNRLQRSAADSRTAMTDEDVLLLASVTKRPAKDLTASQSWTYDPKTKLWSIQRIDQYQYATALKN